MGVVRTGGYGWSSPPLGVRGAGKSNGMDSELEDATGWLGLPTCGITMGRLPLSTQGQTRSWYQDLGTRILVPELDAMGRLSLPAGLGIPRWVRRS